MAFDEDLSHTFVTWLGFLILITSDLDLGLDQHWLPETIFTAWLAGAVGRYTRQGSSARRSRGEKLNTPLELRKVPQPMIKPCSVSAMVWLSPATTCAPSTSGVSGLASKGHPLLNT